MVRKLGFLMLAAGVALVLGATAAAIATYYTGAFPNHFNMASEMTVQLPNLPPVTMPLPQQLNKIADIFAFFIFAFFVVAAGARLVLLGAGLLKTDPPAKEPPPARS